MKNLSRLLLGAVFIASLGCQSPETSPATPPPIPLNSAMMISPQKPVYKLGHDAYRGLANYLSTKHQCETFTIDKVEKAGGDNDLAIDGHGRLWKGTISEKWYLTLCGEKVVFLLVVTPDGKGDSYIAVGKVPSA